VTRSRTPRVCRWVDVIGRTRNQLERVQRRLALPPRLVPLSLSDYLHPTAVAVHPAWFLVTYLTSPSPGEVFVRHPIVLWLAEYAIVTISPWARRRSVLAGTTGLDTTRDGLVCRVLEAAVASHEEVGRHLNDAFFAHDRGDTSAAWHRKERRILRFIDLLDRQLELLQTVGMHGRKIRQVHEQLAGLTEIARYAERKLRESGYCGVCKREAAWGPRKGH
jgi:hypothetical protein